MSLTELKLKIIARITAIEDHPMLEKVLQSIARESNVDSTYNLADEEHSVASEGFDQIKTQRMTSSGEANKLLREELHKFIDQADARILKLIYAMLSADVTGDDAMEASINRGLEQSKKNEVRPHEEVLTEIRARYKV